MSRHFTEEDIQMANKYVKNSQHILVTRIVSIKTAMRRHPVLSVKQPGIHVRTWDDTQQTKGGSMDVCSNLVLSLGLMLSEKKPIPRN